MNTSDIVTLLESAPVIAAVKNDAGLAACLPSPARVVFVLYGSVTGLPAMVRQLQSAGKTALVHIDLIEGLAPTPAAVDYLAQSTQAAGVISTRPAPLRRAREVGLLAVRRFFALDSMALQSLEKQLAAETPHMVEVLPGVMPKVLRRLAAALPVPLIAGGLVADKEDVVNALSAGAVGVSTTAAEVWGL